MMSTIRLALSLAAFSLAAAFPFAAAAPELTSGGMEDLLETGATAFAEGRFPVAADSFRRLHEHFGNEPEFQEGRLPAQLLPLWGYAELQAGAPEQAAGLFRRFLDEYPDHKQAAFVLYGLGTALRQAGRLEEALERLAEYEERYPGRTETALSRLQQGEILFSLERDEDALELLTAFSEGEASLTLRTQARLRALQRAVQLGRLEAAARLLFGFSWERSAMPEAAVLAFAAMEAGDLFLKRVAPVSAIHAYRTVLPHDELIVAQRKRLKEVEAIVRRTGSGSGPVSYQRGYYLGLRERMRRQLEALEQAEDFTPGLLLRRGQAYLLAGRGREAWLVFESLAMDGALDESLRQEAHYRWILAANELERWEEALTIARGYSQRYPASPRLAEAIFLAAQAHAERRRHDQAIEVLTDLLDGFPNHSLRQRWLFSRGFNHVLMDRFDQARDDFVAAAEEDPSTPLAANSQLWEGLTWFFEQDYPVALERFTELANSYDGHRLEGELRYRRATTLYAMSEYDEAAAAAQKFLQEFTGHQREPEAHLLLGNIRMGAGDLQGAFEAFGAVSPEFEELYPHAVFQQGKILRAQQEYRAMIRHFTAYLERTNTANRPRVSEALYWIGWAHAQRDRPERAFPVFLQALHEHGDSPEAMEIQSILAALRQLHAPAREGADDELPASARSLASVEDFAEWLEAERRRALEEGKPTWFAHLSLHLADLSEKRGESERADAVLFEIAERVPEPRIPPAALARVGLFFIERDLNTGERLLQRLLNEFPRAPERAQAYYGLGVRHFDREEFADSLLWLRRFRQEAPAHDLAGEAAVLSAESLLRLGQAQEAVEIFEEVLELRQHRGRNHAEALVGLGRAMERLEESEKAIAYYQRVYTLYRAFDDLVATAYFRSGNLFAEIGETDAARKSLLQLVERDELQESPYHGDAVERLGSLPAATDEVSPEPMEGAGK